MWLILRGSSLYSFIDLAVNNPLIALGMTQWHLQYFVIFYLNGVWKFPNGNPGR